MRKQYSEAEARRLSRSEKAFNEAWAAFFDHAFDAVDAGFEKVDTGEVTMFAFVRSGVEWDRMEARFSRKLAMATA